MPAGEGWPGNALVRAAGRVVVIVELAEVDDCRKYHRHKGCGRKAPGASLCLLRQFIGSRIEPNSPPAARSIGKGFPKGPSMEAGYAWIVFAWT
ncbi:MAG TPA: hypothetical protein VHU84_18445, partial [Lacipirellulaceae bacterium]|nr:hypothetical protein [Lacipirellulaceae bacterium]